MKKYHKIRNVPETVCVREQIAAYNIAFKCHINFPEDTPLERILEHIKQFDIANLPENKVNRETVLEIFTAGIEKYLQHPKIAFYPEDAGRFFPYDMEAPAV